MFNEPETKGSKAMGYVTFTKFTSLLAPAYLLVTVPFMNSFNGSSVYHVKFPGISSPASRSAGITQKLAFPSPVAMSTQSTLVSSVPFL